MVLRKYPVQRPRFGIGWQKWFMPSLATASFVRHMFPNLGARFTEQQRWRWYRITTGIYVMCGASAIALSTYMYRKGQRSDQDQQDEESSSFYYARLYTSTDQLRDPNYKVKIRSYAPGSGVVTKDVTDEVREIKYGNVTERERLDPNYDRYKDEVYVRRRMCIGANEKNFDLAYASAYLRRKDLRNGVIPRAYRKEQTVEPDVDKTADSERLP